MTIKILITKFRRFIFKLLIILIIPILAIKQFFTKLFQKSQKNKIGFLNIEFFHEECGPFGGYGKTAKNITDYFNSNGNKFIFEILLARTISKPAVKRFHNTDVIVSPDKDINKIWDVLKYAFLLDKRNIDFLMTIEYFPGYEYSLLFLPTKPLLIWIHDPRPKDCLEKIATVSLELIACGDNSIAELKKHINYRIDSIARITKLSKVFKRKIIFATTAFSLIERAKRLYGLSDIKPVFLPIPVEIPDINKITYSSKPSVTFLGRLDPIKRPWIFFELAKRFPDVDFFVAGKTHFPLLINSVIEKYSTVQNLKFLGLTLDKDKDELLKHTWAIINTSIHEALPVSFLEALSYGKGIISCQNPDNMAEKFGEYTGEVLGDGFGKQTIDIFANALAKFLSGNETRIEKGIAARKFVKGNYSYERFGSVMKEIVTDGKNEN